MSTSKNQSFVSRLGFACAGFAHALRAERSVQVQAVVLVLVVLAMSLLHVEPQWWALVAVASSGVIGAELLNTAIEHLADHLHPEIHPAIRIVKDCAAAGVLVASVGAVGVAIALAAHLLAR
ncbi:MAG: diacylglycerol kinase [Gammaproteobacteria bacterium]